MAFLKYRETSTPTVPTSTTVKGSGLTNAEVDGNFKSLEDAKFEKSGGGISGDVTLSAGKTLILSGATSGAATLTVPAAVGTTTITFPATTGTVVTTGDTGTVTNTMLAGSIAATKLVDSGVIAGTYGSSISIPSITVDAKGRVTVVSGNNISVGDGTLSLGVSGSGLSGTASFTANQSGNVTFTVTSNATSANTASAIVARDANGSFSSGQIIIANTSPTLVLRDTDNSGTGVGQLGYLSLQDSGGSERAWIGYGSASSTDFNISNSRGAVTIGGNVALHAGNYNNYSPTLIGGGASGNWAINITGSAASASTSSAVNGNIQGSFAGAITWNNSVNITIAGESSFDMNSGSQWGVYDGAASNFVIRANYNDHLRLAENGKNVIVAGSRLYNESNQQFVFANGGSWGINITGSAASATNAGYATNAGSATNAGYATNAAGANGNFYIDDNYGNTVVGLYSSTRYQGVFAMGDSYKLPADGTTTGSLYGIAWSYPGSQGGASGNLDSHGALILINGAFGCALSNSIVASGNVTAYSDERLKTNWRLMPENYVEKLAKVKHGIYDRTDKENITQVGVSAQSFREILPEAITEATDDMKTLSISYGSAALASAVELAREVVNLKSKIAKLESLVESLTSK